MANAVTILVSTDARRAISELDRTGRAVHGLGTTSQRSTGHIGRLGTSLRYGLLGSLTATTGGLAGLGYGMYKAIGAAGDFQKQLSILQAVSGATDNRIEALSKQSIALGRDIRLPSTSAADAASAMTEMSKAGIRLRDVQAGVRGVLQLSAAGELDNADAARIAASTLNQFNLAGTQTGHVADILAGAANASAGEVSDMAESMIYAGTAANAAHQTFADTATAIALMSNKGLQGSIAGTSLANAFRALQAPTAKAQDAMDQFGISIYDAHGQTLPMRDIIENMTAALGDMTEKQQNQTLATIFGTRSVQAARIVFLGGTAAFDKMSAAVDRTGNAQRLAEARTKGFSGAMNAFRSNLETLAIVAGTKLLPVATKVVGVLTDIVGAVGDIAGAPSLNVAINLTMRAAGRVVTSIQDALFGKTVTKKIALPGGDYVIDTRTTEGLVDRFWDAVFNEQPTPGRKIKIGKDDFAYEVLPGTQQALWQRVFGIQRGEGPSEWIKRQWDEADVGGLIGGLSDQIPWGRIFTPSSQDFAFIKDSYRDAARDTMRIADALKTPFVGIGRWVGNVIGNWRDIFLGALVAMPAPIGRIIGRIIDRVKGPFSGLGGYFRRIWENVRDAAVSGWNAITSTIYDWVNRALSPVNAVLGFLGQDEIHVGGSPFKSPEGAPAGRGRPVPHHQKGAIVGPKEGGVYVVAEAGYPEAVLSLDPKYKNRTLELINLVMEKLGVAPQFQAGGIVNPLRLPWVYAPGSQTEFRAEPGSLHHLGPHQKAGKGNQLVWWQGDRYAYHHPEQRTEDERRVHVFGGGQGFSTPLWALSPLRHGQALHGERVLWYTGDRVSVNPKYLHYLGPARGGSLLHQRAAEELAFDLASGGRGHIPPPPRLHGRIPRPPRFAGGGIGGHGNTRGDLGANTFGSVAGAATGIYEALLHPVAWIKNHLPSIPQGASDLVKGVLTHVKDAIIAKVSGGLFGSGQVGRALAEAKRIDALNLPYVWGGGHQSSPAPANGPFDCSGFVSHILQFAGIKIPTMVSGSLMSAGLPGGGALETFANPEHVYMGIAGQYFGTSSYNPGGGPGLLPYGPRPGFTVRHYGNGGIVPGPVGQPQLAVVHGGEEYLRPGHPRHTSGRGVDRVEINVYTEHTRSAILRKVDDALAEAGIPAS